MKALWYLIYKKTWGIVRGWFKKPVSAILTTLAIVIIVFALVGLTIQPVIETNISFSVIALAIAAMLTVIMVIAFVSRNKALVYLNDASFVLAGPFSKKQVLGYVLINDVVQNIWITLGMMVYVLLFLRSSIASLLVLGVLMLTVFSFGLMMIIMTSYDYILERTIASYARLKKYVVYGFILCFVGLLYWVVMDQTLSFELADVIFEHSLVHAFPLFGWIVGALYHADAQNWGMYWVYIGLFYSVALVVAYAFFNTKKDFYEAAIMDSERIQDLMKKAKSGNETEVALFNATIKEKHGHFYRGAWALWSRFLLQAKKTNRFFRLGDIVFFAIYTGIAWFSESVDMYRFMLSIVVFITINSDSLHYELKRPFVYLIPEHNFKKLLILLLPMVYRVLILSALGGLVVFFGFRISLVESLLFVLSLVGIALMLITGTVLTIRLLKGNTNPLVEQLLRMLVILLVLIPAIVVVVVMTLVAVPLSDPSWSLMFSIVVVSVNVVLSFFILKYCQSILAGNDMFV